MIGSASSRVNGSGGSFCTLALRTVSSGQRSSTWSATAKSKARRQGISTLFRFFERNGASTSWTSELRIADSGSPGSTRQGRRCRSTALGGPAANKSSSRDKRSRCPLQNSCATAQTGTARSPGKTANSKSVVHLPVRPVAPAAHQQPRSRRTIGWSRNKPAAEGNVSRAA
jgi:hypothetical protein